MSETDSNWYGRPDALVTTLRRTRSRTPPPTIEHYDLWCELRRGGQGVVYAGRHEPTNRRVAIKILADDALADEGRRLRFEREIDLAAGLRHRGIVSIYDSGKTANQQPYLAMEYVEGLPLDEYLARVEEGAPAESPTVDERLQLFARICDAVSYAHQHGIIHRDLKPSNILIDTDDEPRVLDFGVAKTTGDVSAAGLTATDAFVGTLAFAAPEQVAGGAGAVDVRSDVYALGVILYRILTRREPYAASGPIATVIRAIVETQPEPPSRVRAKSSPRAAGRIGRELDAIVLTALAKAPDRRYQSVDALRSDVHAYLAGDPILARRDNPAYLFGKLLLRHRIVTGLAAALLIAIVAFGASMSFLYQSARTEADKARQIQIFLEDTLASVEPAAPGAEVTVRETLDEALHWIELALADQPEVAAAVRIAVANSYRSLGEYEIAQQQAQLALDAYRELLGEEHPDVAKALSLSGLIHRDQGRFERAEALLREALEMRRRLLGDRHPDVAYAMTNLGVLMQLTGRIDEAEALFRTVLATQQTIFGDTHPDTAMARYRLAELLRAQDDPAGAEALHRAALTARRATLHPEHPDIERSLFALGTLLAQTGRHEDAAAQLRECLTLRTARLPTGHRLTANTRQAVCASLVKLERFEEAESLLLESHERLRSALGDADLRTLAVREELAKMYESWGKPRQAAAWRSAKPEPARRP